MDSKELPVSELRPYERQRPNKKILGFRFHLFLYNLASPEKEKGISGWLKKIGEEPVIWDPVLTDRSTKQFQSYLETKGFYSNVVTDSVKLERLRANVLYSVQFNEPHRIRQITYQFEDQKLASFVLKDTLNCLLKKGNRFDKEVVSSERLRIEEYLKNNGFFRFSKEFIFFEAIEVPGQKLVDIKIVIKENITGYPDPETKVRQHHRYKINSVYLYPDFTLFSRTDENDKHLVDTINKGNTLIIHSDKLKIRPEVLMMPNRCNPGRIYKIDDVRRTYSSYSALGVFRIINIHFKELGFGLSDTSDFRYIDGFIELSPRKTHDYNYEIVGTNSAGDWGARINLLYNNYNLLRGAENFTVRLTGAVERMAKRTGGEYLELMREGGVEASLNIPKLLIPFSARQFSMRYNPKTVISTSYNYQNRQQYIRTIAGVSFSYRWKGNRYNSHQLYPFDFNYVWLPEGIRDSSKLGEIMSSPMANSFINHTILSTRYTFEYSTQVLERRHNYIYLRTNLESAGNLIYGFARLTPDENDSTFLRVPYFRYLKFDADFRINNQITTSNSIIYRFFAGIGYPLGEQKILPFEKMYFSGGPYGVRAWGTQMLGPGSEASDTIIYANRLGDIKLEANVEYRFQLFWVMEGALFIDAGNIWRMYGTRPGTTFRWNSFYNEVAVGTGLGFRFDFSFLILRTDFGIKLRDPSISEGSRWIDFNRSVDYKFLPINLKENRKARLLFQFGIGYPF